MTHHSTELVKFEPSREPVVPMSIKVGEWLAARWLPVAVLLANVLLIAVTRWGLLIVSIVLFVLGRVGYKMARRAVAEAADWSVHLSRIDRYRAQNNRYGRALPVNARYELE